MSSSNRPVSEIGDTSYLRGMERGMSGGFANGDRVVFDGQSCWITGIAEGGRDGARVRLDSLSTANGGNKAHKWVKANLVQKADPATSV